MYLNMPAQTIDFASFAFWLTIVVIVSGILAFIDIIFLRKKRIAAGKKDPWWVEYSRSFFPVLLLVWGVRSFVMQPYRVPTGSLEPTVLPGDFIAVSEFAYGVRLPVIHTQIFPTWQPKRGDITLFRWPVNPHITFVKRVVGLPGDHVQYINKVLFINGKQCKQQYEGEGYDTEPGMAKRMVFRYTENLLGVKHQIFINPFGGETRNINIIVPANSYFVMGDNRDDSDDSRMWGPVPYSHLIGKALMVWMSWDGPNMDVRWHRIGTTLTPRTQSS